MAFAVFSFVESRVFRMNLDGSMQEELFASLPSRFATAIAVDSREAKLYVGVELDGVSGIYRSNLDGSNLELLVPLDESALGDFFALDVDPRHQKVYWLDFTFICRVDASGGVPELVRRAGATDIAVDPDREQLYWLDQPEEAVFSVHVTGGVVETVTDIGPFARNMRGLELDLVHRNLYWVHESGRIRMASMDGGEAQTIREENGIPVDVAIDAPRGHLYWTTFAGQIVRANLDGSGRTVVASDLAGDGFPSGIAIQLDCGNGRIDPGEICDVAIESGQTGACVTECFDNDPCTSDEVTRPGTCSARCEFETITEPIDRDGCCPNDSFTLVDDSDCTLSPWPDVPAVSTWGAVLLSLLLAVGITLKWRGHQAAA